MRIILTTLEKFETIASYSVEAENIEEAKKMVKQGKVAFVSHTHPGNDDEFIAFLDFEYENPDLSIVAI